MSQIKSKKRVKEHGEVFTRPEEVKAMLGLVYKNEMIPIDAKILEPTCGDGNFLEEILKWKLNLIHKFKWNQEEYERLVAKSMSNIYAIEYLRDNRDKAIRRLYKLFRREYIRRVKEPNLKFMRFIRQMLRRNIVHGDSLHFIGFGVNRDIIFTDYKFYEDEVVERHYSYSQFGYKTDKKRKKIKKLKSPKPIPLETSRTYKYR